MQLPVIKTYHPGITLSDHHFFILSKGLNAGKPLDQPCPNCFVATCSNEDDREFFYWLSYALWQCKMFELVLCGSVIPFLHINDVKHCLDRGCHTAMRNENSYRSAVKAIRKHQDTTALLQKHFAKQHQLLKEWLSIHIR